MHLVFLGPPASGKGTLSRILAEKMGVTPLSTGVMLRQHVNQGTELGQQASAYMAASELVPDEIVNGMLSDWFEAHGDEDWILDGFPRTLSQAQWLRGELGNRKIKLDAAISLEVHKDELLRRIRRRVQCSSCGLTTATDLVGGSEICPKCGGHLEPRQDDAEDQFHHRYADFSELTLPVIEFYRKEGNLMEVLAEGNPAEVCQSLEAKLQAKLS